MFVNPAVGPQQLGFEEESLAPSALNFTQSRQGSAHEFELRLPWVNSLMRADPKLGTPNICFWSQCNRFFFL